MTRIVSHWLFVPACVGIAGAAVEGVTHGAVAAGALVVLFLTVFGTVWWVSR